MSGDMLDMATVIRGILARCKPVCGDGEHRGADGLIYCDECGGARSFWRRSDLFDGGEKFELPCMCDCQRAAEEQIRRAEELREARARLERLRGASLMTAKLADDRFEAWRETAENARIKRLCERYCDRWDDAKAGNRGLLFYGPSGTGKTFAATCIANRLLDAGVPVMMTSFVRLVDLVSEGSEMLDKLERAHLLVIDDLGAERDTSTATERVFNIVDTRARQGKPMIITSNVTIDEMREADIKRERIYDRLRQCCYAVRFAGQSWRKTIAAEGASWWENLMQ